MKRILAICVFMLLCTVPIGLFAQTGVTDKGSMAIDVGTVFSFAIYSGDVEETDISFGTGSALNVGYFIIDNLSVGGSLIFASENPKGAAGTETLFSIGPEVNYYLPFMDKMLLDVQGVVYYESVKIDPADAITQLSFGGGAAIVYLMNENLGLYGGAQILLGLDAKQGGTNLGGSFTRIGIRGGIKIFL